MRHHARPERARPGGEGAAADPGAREGAQRLEELVRHGEVLIDCHHEAQHIGKAGPECLQAKTQIRLTIYILKHDIQTRMVQNITHNQPSIQNTIHTYIKNCFCEKSAIENNFLIFTVPNVLGLR